VEVAVIGNYTSFELLAQSNAVHIDELSCFVI
jgi:hypothetical protein